MEIERKILWALVFGAGTTKETLVTKEDRLDYSGVVFKRFFLRIEKHEQVIWFGDVTSISLKKSGYPILLLLSLISMVTCIAQIFKIELYWDYIIWKIPFGILLNPPLEKMTSGESKWIVVSAIMTLLYAMFYYLSRRKSLQIEYGSTSPFIFPLDEVSDFISQGYVKNLIEKWENIKS